MENLSVLCIIMYKGAKGLIMKGERKNLRDKKGLSSLRTNNDNSLIYFFCLCETGPELSRPKDPGRCTSLPTSAANDERKILCVFCVA